MRILILSIILFVFFSCGPEPEAIKTDEQLVLLLVDLHIAEAAAQNLTAAHRDTLLPRYYDQVFELHGYTATDFDITMEELQRKPLELQAIYELVDSVFEARSQAAREE